MDAEKMTKFQLQMRENQEELSDFVAGLGSWANEMKEKENQMKKSQAQVETSAEPPIRNSLLKKKKKKVKKPAPDGSDASAKKTSSKKIHAYDYRAWDKFDVDAACAEVDTAKPKDDDQEEETDEEWEEERRELLAKQEKEKGNAHFKAGQWDNAVECYTTAIRLSPSAPLLFTNRAIAQIKAGRFAAAEADCTSALELDAACAKALYRRGLARKLLRRAADALADFEALLQLEPENKAALSEARELEKEVRPSGEVKAVHKAPAARSKKPLKRIAIEQVGDGQQKPTGQVRRADDELVSFLRGRPAPEEKEDEEKKKKKEEDEGRKEKKEEVKAAEKEQDERSPRKEEIHQEGEEEEPIPRSFSQFARSFAALRFRGEPQLLAFLLRIPPASYTAIFGQCLEPVHLSALLRALCGAEPVQVAAAGLRALRKTPRFGFLAMMVGAQERTALQRLKERLTTSGEFSGDEVEQMEKDYRL